MRFRFALFVVGSLFLAGCGGVETTSIRGTVTVRGKPVKAGAVTFAGPQNYVASGYIRGDGTYEIGNVPVGDVKVTITPAHPVGIHNDDPTKPIKPLPPSAIPAKYATPINDLAFTVTGSMVKDFDLSP